MVINTLDDLWELGELPVYIIVGFGIYVSLTHNSLSVVSGRGSSHCSNIQDNAVKYDKVKCKKGNGLVRWEGSCAHPVPDASMRDWEKGSDLQSCVQNPHPWSMISRNSESITLDGSHCRLGGSSHNGCRWWLKGSHHWLGGSRRFKGTNKHSMGMVGRISLAQWEPSSA